MLAMMMACPALVAMVRGDFISAPPEDGSIIIDAEKYYEFEEIAIHTLGGDGNINNDHVGWFENEEILTYNIEVPTDGWYAPFANAGTSKEGGKALGFAVDGGEQVLANVVDAGGWTGYRLCYAPPLYMSAGTHILTVTGVVDPALVVSQFINIDFFGLQPTNKDSVPGKTIFQAEHYTSAVDGTPGNGGLAYRFGDADVCQDALNPALVYWCNTQPDDSISFDFDTEQDDTFFLELNYATAKTAAKVSVTVDGEECFGPVKTPLTGSWTQFINSKPKVGCPLAAGRHVMTVTVGAGTTITGLPAQDAVNVDFVALRASGQAPVTQKTDPTVEYTEPTEEVSETTDAPTAEQVKTPSPASLTGLGVASVVAIVSGVMSYIFRN